MDGQWERLGDQLDRLITVEMRPARGSVPAGLVEPLYAVCRRASGRALSTAAADALRRSATGRPLLLVTGAGIAPALPAGETDGPPGAVALAAAARRGLSAAPVLVTEDAHAPAVRECLTVVGSAAPLVVFPRGDVTVAGLAAESLLDRYQPGAVVFVERDGANAEGRYHGVRGNCRPPRDVARADLIASAAARRGILTIGIGDGGNEVGFGGVHQQVRNLFPGRGGCTDGCPSGRVTTVDTSVRVSAGVSNWGAYGVLAALAAMTGDLDLIPSPGLDRALVEACVRGGARDGATGEPTASVDGIGEDAHAAVLTLLRTIAAFHLSATDGPLVTARPR